MFWSKPRCYQWIYILGHGTVPPINDWCLKTKLAYVLCSNVYQKNTVWKKNVLKSTMRQFIFLFGENSHNRTVCRVDILPHPHGHVHIDHVRSRSACCGLEMKITHRNNFCSFDNKAVQCHVAFCWRIVRWWKMKPFQRKRTFGNKRFFCSLPAKYLLPSGRFTLFQVIPLFFFRSCLGDSLWQRPSVSEEKVTTAHQPSRYDETMRVSFSIL